MHIVELISTVDNGNTRQYRNKNVCAGCTERILVVSFVAVLFVCAVQCQWQCITCCV